MFDRKTKILGKYFLFLYLIIFLVINWNEVSWIFNYRIVFGIISDFFQREEVIVSAKQNNLTNKDDFEYSDKENSLEIPKIGISAPLIVDKNLDDKEVYQALDRGVVYYSRSVLPGEKGQAIIFGHSAPPGWPKIKYQWVFSRLNDLEPGDEIFVHFNNKKYPYSVKNKIFLERGVELPGDLTNSENILILISCWPPGKDLKRIAVISKLEH